MECWAVLGGAVPGGAVPGGAAAGAPEEFYDPQQRFRPVLDGGGPDIAWNDDDGQVMSYPAVGLDVTAGGPSGSTSDPATDTTTDTATGAESAPLAAAVGAAELHLTDRRAVAVAPDVPGGGHLVAQVDFLCLASVRHTADPGDDKRRRVEIGALTGAPGARAVEVFATSVEVEDVEAIVQGIYAKARSAQSRGNLRPLTPEMLDALMKSGLVRTADACRVDFTTSNLTMRELAVLAYPRRYSA